MPTIFINDLFEVIIEEYSPTIRKNPLDIEIKVIGCRIGEKIDEELISPMEFTHCIETEDMYIIYPKIYFESDSYLENLKKGNYNVSLAKNFSYTTENTTTLTKKEIKDLLKEINLL